MNKPQWTHEHGVLLESLRKRAGMDRATLARRNMLSVVQVEQLEAGGDSGFYNSEIKFSTGKKLLQFLGHTLQVEVKVEIEAEVASSVSNTPSPTLKVAHEQAAAAKPAFKISGLGGALMVMAILMAVFFQGPEELEDLQRWWMAIPETERPDAVCVLSSGCFLGFGLEADGALGLYSVCLTINHMLTLLNFAAPDLAIYAQ